MRCLAGFVVWYYQQEGTMVRDICVDVIEAL